MEPVDPLARLPYLKEILADLRSKRVSLSELLSAVLVHNLHSRPEDGFLEDLRASTEVILGSLLYNPATSKSTCAWAHRLMCSRYSRAIQNLADKDRGWHFGAAHAVGHQVREFRLENMANSMRRLEPELWELMFWLLGGRDLHAEEAVDEEDALYWIGDEEVEKLGSASGSETKAARRRRDRAALIRIKAVVVTCIFMHASDQQCNALQATVGIFLHSCNAPEKLVKVLSRMGLSISLTSIHRAIESLSRQSYVDIETLGRTLLSSHAFDNFDAQMTTLISTLDKPAEGLLHLTSGTLLRLEHARLEDLRCSRLLWERSVHNKHASDPRPFDARATLDKLYSLHPEPEFSVLPGVASPGLSRRGRFRAWHFTQTLRKHGPEYFQTLLSALPGPVPVESIPLSQLYQTPLRAMDINQSTVAGNIEAISNMFKQAGLGNPADPESDENCIDLSEYVILVHGDLGTCERVLSAIRRRAQERNPHDRLQSVVFIMGLFHLKMAAADAIWRVLVAPSGARSDDTSFMKLVGELRPNESSRLVSNAKFRQQHELIGDVSILLELDAWRVEVHRRFGHKSLEEWVAKKPSFGEVEAVAEALARNYVEGEGGDRWDEKRAESRDRINENTKRTLDYLLLYEELAHAMNAGDIGRIETLFPVWIQIFRAVGKHKYAHQMMRFMHELYFVYPDALRNIIRYNILVNPTGKVGEFRAVDWIVELLNLYIKVIYGGEGSNYTKQRILLESVLVLLFRSSHANFERNFHLPGLSYAHAKKDMRETFKEMLRKLEARKPNEFCAGRGEAGYIIANAMAEGATILAKEWSRARGQSNSMGGDVDGDEEETREEEEGFGGGLTEEDLSVEGVL